MKVRIVPLVLALIFMSYGMVFGDGGGSPPCLSLPDAKTAQGPLLQGSFTAAKDGDHFDVHILLEGEIPNDPKSPIIPKHRKGYQPEIRHLFYMKLGPPLRPQDICASSDDDLIKVYKWIPCQLQVQTQFNLNGTPIFKELTVERQEFCNDPQGRRMIYGTVKIIVVPPPVP